MIFYILATYLAKIFDFLVMVRILVRYGQPGEEDSEMILLYIWVAYVVLSVQYVIFGYLNYTRLPKKVGDVFLSFFSSLADEMARDGAQAYYDPE